MHDVRNSSGGSVAVSVHAYSPPLSAMSYYGVEGGYLFRGAVDAGGVGGCGHKPAINMWLSIGYNDAEILSVFPFVRNTTTILMALGLADE